MRENGSCNSYGAQGAIKLNLFAQIFNPFILLPVAFFEY